MFSKSVLNFVKGIYDVSAQQLSEWSAVLRTQNYIWTSIRSIARVVREFRGKDPTRFPKAYYALCSMGICAHRSVIVRQSTTVSSFNFIHSNGICNTGPSTSLGDRNARGNSEVSLTTGEATCSRGIGGRPSLNVRQTTTVSNFNFIDENDVRNIGPSNSLAGRNTRENRKVGLTTGEATCSRGIRRCPSINVCQTATVCTSNFIHDNDVRNTDPSILRGHRNTCVNPEVSLTTGEATCSRDARNTGPSTSCGGRNTCVNPEVSLTIAEATCSSGISRRRSVRCRSSTRGPTVGSSSAAGAWTSYTYTDFRDSDQCCRHCGVSF
ncbi:hypothetical protein Tco_0798971 [Tanacetum coccineum]